MRLQIDTKEKTIRVEDPVNLKELIDSIKNLLPDGAWKEFTLESAVIKGWVSPIIIDRYPPYNPWPTYPWYSNGQTDLTGGTFNVSLS